MIIVDYIEQGTPEWHFARGGVVTASRASEYSSEPKLAPMPDDADYSKEGKTHRFTYDGKVYEGGNKAELITSVRESLPPVYGDMRQSYMAELVAHIATGLIPEEMSFKQCEWGKAYEDEARLFFELETGLDVEEVGFIYRDKDKRFGLSPDGLIKGSKIGLELKCPFTTKVFIEFATCDKIKKEYVEQCQYSMWVTGYDGWYFANYDPRVKSKKLHYVFIERDESYMKKYDNAEKAFISDMDKMLNKLGLVYGSQFKVEE